MIKGIIIVLTITLTSCALTPEQQQKFAEDFSKSFNEGMQEQQRYEQIRQEEAYRKSLQSVQCSSMVIGNYISTSCY